MRRESKTVGIPWYRTEQYTACRDLMADQGSLPPDYQTWLDNALAVQKDVEAAGDRPLKVYIDPKEFPTWCRMRGLARDTRARHRFANFTASQAAGYGSTDEKLRLRKLEQLR